jgi:alpha-mannosidase
VLPSFAAVDAPGVIIETVKPAESGDGIVLRLYESLGRAESARLRVDVSYSDASLTDLMEHPIAPADLDSLEFGPFEIVTVLLKPHR